MRFFMLPFAALITACGPGDEVDVIDVTAAVVDGAINIEWDVDPTSELDEARGATQIGALAVFACDDDGVCPNGRYRHPEVDAPRWYVTGEDYTECTFPQIVAPVTYGVVPAIPAPALVVVDAPAAVLAPGVEHVVVAWLFGGCLSGGPVRAGRATFTTP